jgi:ABC-type Fe3+/spermidine/putrescine transport system ATPase subunit
MNMMSEVIADSETLADQGIAVAVRGLTRAFGGAPVLDDLHFSIAEGEFVALLGRSGSG